MNNVYYVYQIKLKPLYNRRLKTISYIGQAKSEKLVQRIKNHISGNSDSAKIIHRLVKKNFYNYYVSKINIRKKITINNINAENERDGIACNFENLTYANYNLCLLNSNKNCYSKILSFGAYNTKVSGIIGKTLSRQKSRIIKKRLLSKVNLNVSPDLKTTDSNMQKDFILNKKIKSLKEINKKFHMRINENDLSENMEINKKEIEVNNFERVLLKENDNFEIKSDVLFLDVTPKNHKEIIKKIENIL
ncbi:hypothetical protein AKUA1202_11910 [Apilactobacillus kunkeei]|nr:hypothetical protein AKUA1401_11120 [Apilactobacillus kunkeei]CAI2641530.1 hypothetical protein AKUH3B209X_11650 [Apilactobacillus kunkeei]CAI2689509.1 hypothetical protein AKUH4B505J_11270 [Apilactobacillus kunkeei]CAI2691056.1 hypothetical protein AKUA1202_11910 [Apilactobacillus kunkeei]